MRAFAVRRFGETGSVENLRKPEAQDGEVLVHVWAAGVNAMDPILTSGVYKDMMEHRLPLIPGFDFSGTVEAIGSGVQGFGVGDEVFGRSTKPYFGEGTFAEFMTTPTGGLARKPASLSHIDAAALPMAGTTAIALVEAVGPKTGETVVIVGAGGGVGSYATQLAARTGARVIAVTRSDYEDHVRGLGAAEVIDYAAGDLAGQIRGMSPDGVDAIIDLHSDRDTLLGLASTVKHGGRIVSPVNAVDTDALTERGLTGSNVSAATERVGELGDLVASGELRVPVTHTFALSEANEALAEQASRRARGKLVIVIE
ncbi:MAG TPA: NADP-dependent oxidoreductase [Candidatus Saccharimonadales bacterium]|nr:NADP-dependent oxidoreductase [Candidatus Saccharimonadales bacterium]